MKNSIIVLFIIMLTLAGCVPQVTVTSAVTVTLTPANTPQPTETPQPQISPEVEALQKRLGSDYSFAKGEGDYYVIDGDESLKFFIDGTASIEYNGQTLTVLAKDVLNKGTDENGNKLLWVRGFSRTVDTATKDVAFDLAFVSMFERGSIPRDIAPHFNLAQDEETKDKLTGTDKYWARQVYEALGGDELFKNAKRPTEYQKKYADEGFAWGFEPLVNGKRNTKQEVRDGKFPARFLDVAYFIPYSETEGFAGIVTAHLDTDGSVKIFREIFGDNEKNIESMYYIFHNKSIGPSIRIYTIEYFDKYPVIEGILLGNLCKMKYIK